MNSKLAAARPSRLALSSISVALITGTFAAPAIDGTDDGTEGYTLLSSQTNSGFGADNILANIKTVQEGNNLHVLLGGLVKDNAIILFIDSKPGGINFIAGNTITSGGEEFSINNLAGMTFEAGFEADFAVRIYGSGDSTGAFHNTYNLSTGVRDYAGNSLGDPSPIATNVPILAGFGTVWSALPSPQTDAINGPELALDLGAMGVPSGTNDVKLLAFVSNGGSTFLADCVLGALPSPGNLGEPSAINFETITGTQTLTVSVNAANPDNDGDGLLNDDESDNGPNSYNGPTDTGTDPNNPDSDGDYLEDGFEVTNNTTLGTDPTLADTDGDGVNDATEVSLGSNVASGPAPDGGAVGVIGFDYFDYADGGIDGSTGFEQRVFDFDNHTANDSFIGHTGAVAPWSTSFGTQVRCGRLLTENSNAIRAFNGAFTGGSELGRVENIGSINSKEIYARVDVSRLAGASFSGLSFVDGTDEVAFAGVRGVQNGGEFNFGVEIAADAVGAFTGDIPLDRSPNTIVARLNTEGTPGIAIWVDPDLSSASPPAPDATVDFVTSSNAVATGIRLASGGRALWDNLVVTTNWEDLDTAAPTDADTDALRDSWEELFAPGNLPALSAGGLSDGDNLTNAEEQALGTNPLEDDTDEDSLLDHVETNTGIFVSASDTGSDPCDDDTDDDNLTDDVENGSQIDNGPAATGSDPNKPDSDNDGENDGFEVFQGTDPNDANKNSILLGLLQVNGVKDSIYGTHDAVQTVNTQFGDNFNELNAAYSRVQDGKLYLMLTGNLQDSFNKLEIFIDSKSGGQDSYSSVENPTTESAVDGTDSLDGMFFETGFTADYHLIARRGNGKFDLDIIDLQGSSFSSYEDILSFGTSGYGATGTGVNAFPIRVGYDGSNTGGVVAGTGPAVEADALAVNTGLEICIDLADLGEPSSDIKLMVMINNAEHSFLSNQVLAGIPAGSDNIGNPNGADFDFQIDGDQSFTVSVIEPSGPVQIDSVTALTGGKLQIVVSGLTSGSEYQLTESANLVAFGTPAGTVTVGGSTAIDGVFTAAGTTATLEVNLPAGDRAFYRLEEAPGS